MTSNSVPGPEERELELMKFEYEQAAQRYENIYRAVWQIFSYMALLTGAILTFGSRSQLPFKWVVIIAPFPLIFWLFAIFFPMDKYGQLVRKRLKEIEQCINETFLTSSSYKFSHYIEFAEPLAASAAKNTKNTIRVSFVVKFFALICLIGWIAAIVTTFNNLPEVKSDQAALQLVSPAQVQMQDPQIRELREELKILSEKLDSIESLLRERTTGSTGQQN